MEKLFSIEMSGLLFARNVLLFSFAGLFPVLVLYVLLTPGFAGALTEGGPAFWRFMRQVLTNGLPVVFAINYVACFLFALSRQNHETGHDQAVYMVIDIFVRLAIFVGLHALIYVGSATWFGSFGGSRTTALRVVAPTLSRSALFENVSGVYFYATLVSAVPLYASTISHSAWFQPIVRVLPRRTGALALALLFFLAVAACLTALASAFARLQI